MILDRYRFGMFGKPLAIYKGKLNERGREMKKSDLVKMAGGFKVGMEYQVSGGPQDGKVFKITAVDVKDPQGFEAVEVTFRGGEWEGAKEVCANEIMYDVLDGKFEHSLKRQN